MKKVCTTLGDFGTILDRRASSTMVSARASQAWDEGSIPFWRSTSPLGQSTEGVLLCFITRPGFPHPPASMQAGKAMSGTLWLRESHKICDWAWIFWQLLKIVDVFLKILVTQLPSLRLICIKFSCQKNTSRFGRRVSMSKKPDYSYSRSSYNGESPSDWTLPSRDEHFFNNRVWGLIRDFCVSVLCEKL